MGYFRAGKIPIAAVILIALALAACVKADGSRTSLSMNLLGPVKSVQTSVYKAVEREGTVEKGERQDYAGMNCICRFDEKGFVTVKEFFGAGDLTGWSEYLYGADDRLEKVVFHSVYFDGDNVSVVEYGRRGDYVCRTYGEAGDEISESHFSRRGNRSIQAIVTPQDSVVIIKRCRRGKPLEEERIGGGYTSTTKYEYDRKGNESVIESYMNGELQGSISMEYTSCDSFGNWTSRVVYDVEQDGNRIPSMIEERRIEYY